MKVKKHRESFFDGIKSIADRKASAVSTFISMDINGSVIIEGFKKLIDYTDRGVTVNANGKLVYLHGESLKITACNKYNIFVSGKITSIELFEVK